MNKKHRITIEIIVGLSLILALYFSIGIRSKSIRPKGRIKAESSYRLVMGTFARVTAVAADSNTADKCIEAAFEQLRSVESLMSIYRDDSQISEINRSACEGPVKISTSTFEVLQKAVDFSRLSAGAFDITIGPLVALWQSAAEANCAPTDAELQQARSKLGYEKLILDANEMSVRFAVDGMKLDAGGITKGYAIDKAIEAMQMCGAAGGLVDVGGDIRCFGTPPQSQNHWLIGLQDPDKAKNDLGISKPLLLLKLTDAAVATSGDYQRFALIEGRRYSHIMDSRTGTGVAGLSSVTVIAKSAIDADALATAVSVMGDEKGLALIKTIPLTEAILITSEHPYKILKTSGAEKFIK